MSRDDQIEVARAAIIGFCILIGAFIGTVAGVATHARYCGIDGVCFPEVWAWVEGVPVPPSLQ